MFYWDYKKRVIVSTVIVGIIFSAAFYFVKIYQSPAKTDDIYKQALADYEQGDYQNSYYLFSRITLFSNLKPIAIYHQAECARMLNDDKSALKQYQFIFNNYPKHKLAPRSRYMAAQLLVDKKPKLAKKYFEEIIKSFPDTDYAIAAEYYCGLLLKNKYSQDKNKIFPMSVKSDIENYFRHYLTKAPSGRLAMNVVNNWLELDKEISSDDYLLMARATYNFGDYQKTRELLAHSNLSENWALDVKNSDAMGNYPRAKFLTETGLKKYSQYVDEQDIFDAIDIYLKLSKNNSEAVNHLLTISSLKGRDYLLNLKCDTLSIDEKDKCYSYLYLKYPTGRFSADALSNIFFAKIKKKDYQSAIKVGQDHLNKFPDSNSAPMVMFWLGKIYERLNEYAEYTGYYRKVISSYPDDYYAYRAYLRLNRMSSPLITNYINPQPVVYPYKYTKNNIIVKLVDLKDYDVLNELSDDDFVKSWVLYKKGDYPHSMMLARDAMDKVSPKPDKYDLRWRLVYPLNYYEDIHKYASITGNNIPLIQSLVREESYFDPLAQSAVGATGLMQLMPSTAFEISSKFGLGITSQDVLFNPHANLKAGNYYYAYLKSLLSGYDVSTVAAYNGGIGSLQRWKNSLYYNDTDEFVEQIPYSETQNYVKKVFRSYWNYIRIYSGNN